MFLAGILALALAPVPWLWSEPASPPNTVDFERPANGRECPVPPFRFIREDLSGTSPKVLVYDATGREWQAKGGLEGRAEAFATRLVSALGYYADTVCFLRTGRMEQVRWPDLKRARGFIRPDGSFTYAAFELREAGKRFRQDLSWTWQDNPFVGTPAFNGLRILMMLVSNWDNKDGRDVRQGPNTGILEQPETGGPSRYVYFVSDWGQSFGGWGRLFGWGRSNWNCGDFDRQSDELVTVNGDGSVRFGYRGQHTDGFVSGITTADVRWLTNRLGRITDQQLRDGLRASGASVAEEQCFTAAVRRRIEILKGAAQKGGRELR